MSKTRAISAVADRYGLSDDTVKNSVRIAEAKGMNLSDVGRGARRERE